MAKYVVYLAVVGFLAFGLASAEAADGSKKKRDPEKTFQKLDKDGNGLLNQSEFVGKKKGDKATAAEKKFQRKDADNDGSLTLTEFKSSVKKLPQQNLWASSG